MGLEARGRGLHAGRGLRFGARTLLPASPCDVRGRPLNARAAYFPFGNGSFVLSDKKASTSASPDTEHSGLLWARRDAFEE